MVQWHVDVIYIKLTSDQKGLTTTSREHKQDLIHCVKTQFNFVTAILRLELGIFILISPNDVYLLCLYSIRSNLI